MSATSGTVSVPGRKGATLRDPRLLMWVISFSCLGAMAGYAAPRIDQIASAVPETLTWILALAMVNSLPVSPYRHITFVLDSPVTVLTMLVLQPSVVALAAFIGTIDPREMTRQVTPTKAVYNRTHIAFEGSLGSLAAHALAAHPASSNFVIPIAFTARITFAAANALLVSLGAAIASSYRFDRVLRNLLLGQPSGYFLTQSLAAVVGGALAVLYPHSRVLAIMAALAVCVVSRQALARSQTVIDTSRAYRSREQALKLLSHQMHQERADERRLIAAELHDEVLQPMFKVTLMAQVLKGDLASGRLLDLDQDLPELLTAADLASTTLRELIGDLRRSALGRGGLAPALTRFVESASERTQCHAHLDVEPVNAPPDVELVLYQIGKEAITNALTHSKAENVWVTLRQTDEGVELAIIDDGCGFDPDVVHSGHYGLEIMSERAAALPATLFIDTSPSAGTRVVLVLPEPWEMTESMGSAASRNTPARRRGN